MSFSGITLAGLCDEFNNTILNGKISKISQPESLGLVITVHTDKKNYKLYISANASMPLIYLTDKNKTSPLEAYSFVMVLRKHVSNARITRIEQIGLERVLCFELEHLDELKDVVKKHLYVEIMGKHSNIIFTDENDKIIDAIKHIGITQSSVREVLPGKKYFIPVQSERMDIYSTENKEFYNKVLSRPLSIEKAISSSFVGFSKTTGVELATRAGLDADLALSSLHESEKEALCEEFIKLKNALINKSFSPCLCLEEKKYVEYSAFMLESFAGCDKQSFDSLSNIIELFYSKKNDANLIKQKSTDLRKIVSNHIDRANKKLLLQEKQLNDTNKMEKLRLYGELLQTYQGMVQKNDKELICENYYDNNKTVKIPLNPDLNAIENSNEYFKKYNKYKRTKDALIPQIEATRLSLDHLSSIETALTLSENEDDLKSIRNELYEYGYIKKAPTKNKGKSTKSLPLHYISSDGFDLYVGKNNYQNEEVTFKIARGNDWWFHAKQMTGSHVIIKDKGIDIPDKTFEEAAGLAAYYSEGRNSGHVEVDYVRRKELRRVPGAAKGFVIYYTNYSMTVAPDIDSLQIAP